MGLQLQSGQREQSFHIPRRRGKVDGPAVKTVRLQAQGQFQTGAGKSLQLHSPGQTIECSAGNEDERLERDQRPLQVHSFAKLGEWLPGLQRLGIDATRRPVQVTSALAKTGRYFALRKSGQLADRCQSPALKHFRSLELGRQTGQGQGSEKTRFTSGGYDGRRVRQLRGDARRQLARGNSDADRKTDAFHGMNCRLRQRVLPRRRCLAVRWFFSACLGTDCFEVAFQSTDIEVDHSGAGIFDTRRKTFGDLHESFLRCPLALDIARAGDQFRQQRARLGQSQPRADPFSARPARR